MRAEMAWPPDLRGVEVQPFKGEQKNRARMWRKTTPGGVVLVFPEQTKLVCFGEKSEDRALALLAELAEKVGSYLTGYQVTNLVGCGRWANRVNRGETWSRMQREEGVRGYFEPELFPAITLSSPCCCKIFESGKYYVTGVASKEDLNEACSKVRALLTKCGVPAVPRPTL